LRAGTRAPWTPQRLQLPPSSSPHRSFRFRMPEQPPSLPI
jgi:hypothetical protein